MVIHDFEIRNFLIHRSTKLGLSPIVVFVGPNGGGKSALFDALLNFSMVARGNIRQAFGQYPYSYAATRFHGAGRLDRIGFTIVLGQSFSDRDRLRYTIDYAQQGVAEPGIPPTFSIRNETLTKIPSGDVIFDRNRPYDSPLKTALSRLEEDRSIFAAVRQANFESGVDSEEPLVAHCTREVRRVNRFRLNPFSLAGSSRLPDTTPAASARPRLGHEGEDLAACLYNMQETKDAALETIVERVKAVAPGFGGFEFNSFGSDRIGFAMTFQDDRGVIPSVCVSQGLLLFVGLMVLTYSPDRPPIMLIEEPENGLTPTALREFYSAIRQLAQREDPTQRSQVLISSHSPFIICEAWNGDDRDFIHQVKVDKGASVVRKFSEVAKENGAVFRRDDAGRPAELGLRAAELLMSGYLA
jgi:predicted ATPase